MSRRVVRIALRTCRPEVFPSTLKRLWSSGLQASWSAMGFYMLARVAGCRWDDRALLSEVTLAGSLGHEFRRPQFIAPKTRGSRTRPIIRTKNDELSAGGFQLFLDVFATNGVGMC